ncbi:MAG: glycosyltransferase family 2 protein [bacterium]|nr:glycosyltransferase family 2 protein [bacterium]
MKISVIIPFHNEEENVDFVLNEVRNEIRDAEIIAIDDGSTDKTALMLKKHSSVNVISFKKRFGQSAALYAGLLKATCPICVMMDGDGQNDPRDISRLVSLLGSADVVCGRRDDRRDDVLKIIASRLANFIRRISLGDDISDTGCAMKALRREHVRHIVPFNGFHRYMPNIFGNAGLSVVEMPVNHRPRRFGKSKYSIIGRGWRGMRDLLGMKWLMSRQIKWPDDFKL